MGVKTGASTKQNLGSIGEDLLPDIDDLRKIGSQEKRWNTLYAVAAILTSMLIGSVYLYQTTEGFLFVNASTIFNKSIFVNDSVHANSYFGNGSQLTGISAGGAGGLWGTNKTQVTLNTSLTGGIINVNVPGNLSIGNTTKDNLTAEFRFNGSEFLFNFANPNVQFNNSGNTTFRHDVIIVGNLYGGSALEIVTDVNMTSGTFYLGEFETSAVGGAKVVKRNNANGALFGIGNDIPGANTHSGGGYVTFQDCGNYTVDAHSSLDLNNPNEVVHHLRGCLSSEKWRLSSNLSSTFNFEDGIDSSILQINRSEITITGANLSIEDIEVRAETGNYLCIDSSGVLYSKTSGCDI